MGCKNEQDTFGIYDSVAAAKKACDDNNNCGKLCDKYCNGLVITLCTKGAEEVAVPESVLGSCLYKHTRDSKYQKSVWSSTQKTKLFYSIPLPVK